MLQDFLMNTLNIKHLICDELNKKDLEDYDETNDSDDDNKGETKYPRALDAFNDKDKNEKENDSDDEDVIFLINTAE